MRMTVAELMSDLPITIGPNCTADQALDAIYEYETPELYVVDKSGRFLGILPDYELLKAELNGEAVQANVEKLMSRIVPTVSPDTDAAEVARSFRESKCSRFPVVKAGKLVGIVTRADVIRVMAVLKRITPEVTEKRVGPKRPKLLSSSKSSANRVSRAKSMEAKPTTRQSRSTSNSNARRSMASTSR